VTGVCEGPVASDTTPVVSGWQRISTEAEAIWRLIEPGLEAQGRKVGPSSRKC
jgi:hypothetical protein